MRRFLYIVFWVIFIVCVYWAAATFVLQRSVASYIENSGDVSTALKPQPSFKAFPQGIGLDIEGLTYRIASNMSWNAPHTTVQSAAHMPQNVKVSVIGEQTFITPFGTISLSSSQSDINVLMRVAVGLPLDAINAKLTDVRFVFPDERALTLRNAEIHFKDIQSSERAAYSIDAVLSQMSLQDILPDFHPDLQSIENIAISLDAVYSERWSILGTTPNIHLDGLNIHEIQTRWGESHIIMSGGLASNAHGEMSGHVLVRIAGWEAALENLENAGFFSADVSELLRPSLERMQRDNTVELKLTVEDNRVSYGMFTLGWL